MFKHFPFIHNHGDFVHLDALRDWLRGVVSLESFLKSKNDKAIVKDMHFTDETTSVDYIDTKDDKEKTETLCEYLTSDVYDKTNPSQFKKVDKITVIKDSRGENWVNLREKGTQEQRLGVIRSNVPIAYDATDNYSTSFNRSAYLGVTNRSIKVYSDDTLNIIKRYEFCNPIAYNVTDDYKNATKAYYVGVNEDGVTVFNTDTQEVTQKYNFKDNVKDIELNDCNPFGSCYNQQTGSTINITLHQPSIVTKIGNVIVNGQFMYELATPVTIQAGKGVTLNFLQNTLPFGGLGDHKFSRNFFAKHIEVLQHDGQFNSGVISTISRDKNYPIGHGNISVALFNSTDIDKNFDTFLFTF